MQYIMTVFWSVVLVTMLNYVVSSVQNVDFVFMNGIIMSIPVAIMVLIIAAIIPDEPTAKAHH
ncbi:MAG: YjzD family protein [Psychrobacillus psychrotolerans]